MTIEEPKGVMIALIVDSVKDIVAEAHKNTPDIEPVEAIGLAGTFSGLAVLAIKTSRSINGNTVAERVAKPSLRLAGTVLGFMASLELLDLGVTVLHKSKSQDELDTTKTADL